MNKKLLLLVLGLLNYIAPKQALANSVSDTDEQVSVTSPNSTSNCYSSGGQLIQLTAQFDTLSGLVNGVSKYFCQYTANGNRALIGLSTISTTPTLAATYAKQLQIDPNKPLPESPYADPALNVCSLLHGSEIVYAVTDGGFANGAGQFDICVFGDDSSISAWTMVYIATGSRSDLKNVIPSLPLNIKIPTIN